MIDERDIWGSAKIMIDRFGDEAAIEAARRADKFLAAGSIDGKAIWERIEAAIVELQRRERGDSEAVH
jgi:hypothetical protein